MARTLVRRNVGLSMAAGGLAALLAACGGGGDGDGGGSPSPSPSAPGRSTEPGVTQVDVRMTDYKLDLSRHTFSAGDYTFVAKNDGSHVHALEIEGSGIEKKTSTVSPGDSAKFDVTLKSGTTYELYCPVDGHKDLGMRTTLTVGDGASPKEHSSTGGY